MKNKDLLYLVGGFILVNWLFANKASGQTPLPQDPTGGTTGGSTTGGTTGGSTTGGSTTTSTFNPATWGEFFIDYAMPGCYFDCSVRYDALRQIQELLNDTQLIQASDYIRTKTGKTMYQNMSDMSWFGGPYTNNQATALYNRLQNL